MLSERSFKSVFDNIKNGAVLHQSKMSAVSILNLANKYYVNKSVQCSSDDYM